MTAEEPTAVVATPPVQDDKTRLLTLILANKDKMTAEYKHLVKHTGGLTSASMTYAYSKAINDIVKLIAKDKSK